MRTDGITFLIAGRDHELVLPRAIGSAMRAVEELEGHGVPAEVLVVDDASRDGSAVLLRQLEALYHDRGLRVLAPGRVDGRAAARDAGLHGARHRFAVLMDADGELIPGNVHHFYRSIRATGAAVVFGAILSREGGVEEIRGHESFVARMFERNHIDAFALYDVDQLIDAGALRPGRDAAEEDWEMLLHLAAAGRRLVHVPLAFGLCHRGRDEAPGAADGEGRRLRRMGRPYPEIREQIPPRALHLRYHPDLGYL